MNERQKNSPTPRRVAIIGAGISGLGAAWALHRHPDLFDFLLFEAQSEGGGNAITVDMLQNDGSSIPFDISITACIPSVYHHILLFMQQHGIGLVDTRFSYSVRYRGEIYAHDFDSDIRRQLQPEIEKFQKVLGCMKWFGRLNRSRSRLLNALNPFNYFSMGTALNLGRFSGDFRYKILKPMFVNFLMATNVFDMPASLVFPLPGILRYRIRHPDADVGSGYAANLREHVSRLPGQDIP